MPQAAGARPPKNGRVLKTKSVAKDLRKALKKESRKNPPESTTNFLIPVFFPQAKNARGSFTTSTEN
jgi:hypothetical protein